MYPIFSSALAVAALATASILISTPAHADVVSFEYEITANDPTSNTWPLVNPCADLNAWYPVEKRVIQMDAIVSVTGTYDFSDQFTSGEYQDGRMVLLSTAFNEDDPSNCLVTLDDSGAVELQADTTYRLALTSYSENGTGSFSYQADGPGVFEVVGLADSSLIVDSVTVDAETPAILAAVPVSTLLGVDLSGMVTFSIDGVVLGQAPVDPATGEASFDAGVLPGGTYTISASYAGVPAKTRSSDGTNTLIVTQVATATSLSAAPNPQTAGEVATLTAIVTGAAPTGTVEFFNGTTSLGTSPVSGGSASLPVTLPVGAYSLTAVYSGDLSYLTSTSVAATVTVNPAQGSGTTPTTPVGQQLAKTGAETPNLLFPFAAAAAILTGLVLMNTRRRATQ